MIKYLLGIAFILVLIQGQYVTPYYILPTQSTQDALTSYALLFHTDTPITTNAQVVLTFPFEFSPNQLTQTTRIRYSLASGPLTEAKWSVSLNTFSINVGQISIGNISLLIDGIRNPKEYTTSSYFVVKTKFNNVVVTSNNQFGRVPFTPAPIVTAGGVVKNHLNVYIEQGASYTFTFTPSKTYPAQSSLRFIFPEGFSSNQVQCNVSGVADTGMKTRVLPGSYVYDCLNLKKELSGQITVILSGLVNPNYQMSVSDVRVHILQPNNMIVQEIITSTSVLNIMQKPLNATIEVPNKYRNNSVTYIAKVNLDTDLLAGDYLTLTFTGSWTLFTNATKIISGVISSSLNQPKWVTTTNTTASLTSLTLTNFSKISKSQQLTFYQPLVTPLAASTYTLTLSAYRANGGLAQTYSRTVDINQTTGYIKEMKLHPMQSPIKLPVGNTGPIEIVLFLRNNLPKTNVLTYGQIVIDITPNIPAPIVGVNGVPKCYFYYSTPATNCTFDSSNPAKTVVTIFTPTDFNFQQSEVPLTITTEGFTLPQNQGITIDTLVKRYFFEIQFYSHERPPPIPLEVIFDEWIPDSIGISSVTCETMNRNVNQYDHIKCSFVTPNQVLNSGHTHFFRVEFGSSSIYSWDIGWIGASNTITPDYPCLMYGANVSAVPYVKCDYVTWQSGPYKSSQLSTSYSYVTFYGLGALPGGSTVEFQIPKIQRNGGGYNTNLQFAILEDTPGYTSPIVYIYTQVLNSLSNTGGGVSNYAYEIPSMTLTNSVINKVTDITLNSYALGTTDPRAFILEVDQVAFPNIGRGNGIACGSHVCSKFDRPVQYFILYPSTALGSSATLTFPSIATPPYSGDFTFYTRIFKSGTTNKKGYFTVTIIPEQIVTYSYSFHANQTVTTLYPNSDHFYTISWTTVNPLLTLGGNAKVNVNIDNVFTLSSTYCQVTTSTSAYDGRGIWCQLTSGGTSVDIKNLGDAPAGSTFSVTLQMTSISTAATVSPTVTIKTYYGNNAIVDQAVNIPFAITPLTNTNLTVLSSFSLPSYITSSKGITAGYFGHLLIAFDPVDSATVVNGSRLVLTMPNEFTPASNTLGLPLSCILNNKRLPCTYTINPFVVTVTKANSSFTTGSNILNITTEYQNVNGINFPSSQGRYYLQLQILNNTNSQSLEKVQQVIDILPPDVGYFNVSWAVRDIDVYNIWTIQFQNGLTVIPSYNDGANAGRITFGFPTVDENNAAVFAADLGFTNILEGAVLPCYFQAGAGFVAATSGKTLICKIRKSYTNNYHTWVEVVNFAAIPAGGKMRLFLAKAKSPSVKQIDIDFTLKVATLNVATNIQSQLYLTTYNMFIDMVTKSITNRNEPDSTSIFFQAGAKVGMSNQFLNMTPYTGSTFQQNDWWIVDLDTQFPLSGNIYNCQKPYYQYCMIYPTINWLAVKIGNGTILTLQPFVSQLPLSISRVDTTFQVYTFLQGRWSQTITYTVTANYRWLELRGSISAFSLQVVGTQNNLNINQKNVEVLVRFTTEHKIPKGGSIQIRFPNNATTVPAIKQHCRSAVTMGSVLYGYDTGKPAINVQGQIGCSVQNSYSWIITGFAQLLANSQVVIYGMIDFPTTAVSTLGMGYICTYSNQDSTNTFTTAKTIDYLSTNFPLAIQNLTWSVDPELTKLSTAPLRVNHVGELKFYVNLDTTFTCSSFGSGSSGQIYINVDRVSSVGNSGGFGAPPADLVCTIVNPATGLKYGCGVNNYASTSQYYGYQILSYQNLPASTVLQVTITTLHGSGTEGIPFPTSVGIYKTELEINYCDSCTNNKAQAQYVQVYGPDWSVLDFHSTVTIPSQNNFIIVQLTPSASISASQQIVIEIPTVALDGTALFPADLGMGYKAYDKLVFDLFQSGISSMDCRVYPGNINDQQPTKIVCSAFSTTIGTSTTVKFGFWVVNPTSSVGMSIPVQVYAYDQPSARKYVWSILEAGIRLLPVTVTPISELGNFATSSSYRQISGRSFDFTTRNTKKMYQNDWYILKFAFELRQSANSNGNFKYNSGFSNSGDVIFMQNCKTVLLRVGATDLNFVASGSITTNARINNLFYNPPYQLTTAQSTIKAYAIYKGIDECQRIYYSDLFPTLVPNQPMSPTFTISNIYTTEQRGMLDDWYITFRMSSSAGNSSSLVKLISIEVPDSTVSDVVLTGRQCVQRTDSTVQLSECVIDPTNRMIWMTPVKSSYTDSSYLRIETVGKAIKTASNLQTNRNQFVIRYYTWPDTMTRPSTIIRGSDNWCFMKQDSTNIGSSVLSFTKFTSSVYSAHSYLSIPETNYVNEWQPAHYFIGNSSHPDTVKKSPFVFKLISPATFNSYDGTSNYHYISVDFTGVYSYPTLNQMSNDLYFYTPVCLLNGFSIMKCTITGSVIKMEFQQAIANGEHIGVSFNIVNPKDQADQGFILTNTNNPTVTMPVYIYNRNTGTTYMTQPDQFHTYYQAVSNTATYPSYGIQDVSVVYGTQIQGQLNYLQFTVTLTRTDINGFIIEIPVVSQDGTKIYNDPTLMGLDSGSQYPCSLGIYKSVYCYYQKGNSNGYGTPTRIYITNFGTITTTFNFRMLFTNPDNNQVFPSFIWKAFGGSYTSPDLMGQQFKGVHQLVDAFKIYTTVNYYSTGSLKCFPTKSLYQTGTYYDCYTAQQSMPANTYAIMKWPLVDPTYGSFGDYTHDGSSVYDHFFMYEAQNKYYVYLVLKLTSGFTAGTSGSGTYAPYDYITSYYRFGYLRMKHHLVNGYSLYLLMKPSTKIYTCTVYSSFMDSYRVNNYFGTWSIYDMDTQVKISGYNGWQFVSVNAGNTMSAYASDVDDSSEKVVEVQFYTNKPYSSLSSTTTDCLLESGLISSDPLKPITCYLDRSNNRLLFRNVFWFTNTRLNFYYYATTASDSINFDVRVYVWANEDAYNQRNWKMYSSTTGSNWSYEEISFASNPSYDVYTNTEMPFGNVMDLTTGSNGVTRTRIFNNQNTRTEGYATILSVTSTQIQVRLYASVSKSFYKVFRMGFRFYTPRLLPGTCSSVSVYTSRWGWNNFNGNSYSPGSFSVNCGNGGTNSRKFYAIFDMWYTTSQSRYPYQWPDYSNGDTYDFTFTFSSVSGAAVTDYPNYLWVSASMLWEQSYYYYRHSVCGVCSNPCCSWDWLGYCDGWCPVYCSCRRMYGWDYYTFTGTQGVGYSPSPKALASSASLSLLSGHYSDQTQFGFALNNMQIGITSTMTSFTNEAHAQLIIQFNGNINYPSNNPFPYTSTSQQSAYIDCLCVRSTSSVTFTASTSYTPGNCTRHIISGMNPFISLRYTAPAGSYLYCYFPGFKVPSSGGGSSFYVNFYWNHMHFFKNQNIPSQHYSEYKTQSSSLTLDSTGTGNSFRDFNEANLFWTNYGQVLSTQRYYLYLRQYSSFSNPFIYYSAYYPKPSQSICSDTNNYYICRTYNQFNQRRYYIVAQPKGSVSTNTFDYTGTFPQSKDVASSFYSGYCGWTRGGTGNYYAEYTWTANSGYLSEATPTYGVAVPIYGSTLVSYSSPFVIAINLNGHTLYSNQRTTGQNTGSFIQITASSFSTLYGCGAYLQYEPARAFSNNALYCLVISSTVLKIFSNSDLTFTGKLIVTFSTSSVPSSTTITVELYDKYVSGSDYGRSVRVQQTITNNPGYTILANTNIKWRKMAYKQLRTDAAPLRLTLNNNYQYVSVYSTTSNSQNPTASNGIIIQTPSTLSGSQALKCIAREYSPTKYHLYTEYNIACSMYSTTQVLIQSIPSHILKPEYYYEFVVYQNMGASSPFVPLSSSANSLIRVWSGSNYNSFSTQYFDVLPVDNFLDSSPITLNSIYFLTREQSVTNSLLLDITVNLNAPAVYFLQFVFDAYDLSYFGISNGKSIPCYLSGLSAASGKSEGPVCFGYSTGTANNKPLIVRVVNIASFSSGQNIKIALDNFSNPPIQTLFVTPINVRVRLQDRTNKKVYSQFFPNIYYSHSELQNTGVSSGSLIPNSNYLGASTYHSWTVSWPYTTTSNVWDKLSIKMEGGVTCCSPYSSLATLSDQWITYTRLWVNTKANTTVYQMPARSSGTSTVLRVNNVVNPNPVDYATYQKAKLATIKWHGSYLTKTIYTLSQPNYGSYSKNSDFVVSSSPSYVSGSAPNHFPSHQYYPLVYQFSWNINSNLYSGRNLSYILLTFTGGIRWLEDAWFYYAPSVINPTGSTKIGYNALTSNWYVNITGVQDSSFSSSHNWYLKVRLYASNNNYVTYSSYLYNYNGQQEFQTSSGAFTPSNNGFSTNSLYGTPNMWSYQHLRYTPRYYELQRTQIYAKAGATTNKLFFKFKAPYNISEVESITLRSSSNTFPASSTPANGLYCTIQPTVTQYISYGAGLYCPCIYNSGTFTITAPIGGLAWNKEYLLTIIDRQQMSSTFNMPTSPARIDISLIYNSYLNLAYGDVYTLDFAGYMTSYAVSHSHLMSGIYDMLGFTFRPSFALAAASTSAPVTESVLSFQVQSKYYNPCLSVDGVFSPDNMPFYSGVYYSHWASIAVASANTRIKCGANTQAQNYAPAILSITDYGTLSTASTYYFRFPLIALPSGTAVPLTYKVKLLSYANGQPYPTIISQYNYEAIDRATTATSDTNQWADVSLSSSTVQSTMAVSFSFRNSGGNFGNGAETVVKFKNNYIDALTSLNTLTSLSNSNFAYEYYPNINLALFRYTGTGTTRSFNLGSYPTSTDQQTFTLSFVQTYEGTTRVRGYFNSGTNLATYTVSAASSWSTSTYTKGTQLVSTNSHDKYTISWQASYLTFPEGSYMIITFNNRINLLDQYCYSYSGFIYGVNDNSNLVCKRYSSNQILISGYATLGVGATLSVTVYASIQNSLSAGASYTADTTITVISSQGNNIISAGTGTLGLTLATTKGCDALTFSGTMVRPYSAGSAFPLFVTFRLNTNTLTNGDYLQVDFGNWIIDPASTGVQLFKYQVSGSIYWVPSTATLILGNIYKVPVYNNYSMVAGTTITLRVDTLAPDAYYGAQTQQTQWNNFKIYAYKSSALVEQQVFRIWTEPFGHVSLAVSPVLAYVGVSTLYEFSVTPNVSAVVGDTILIEFTTADGLQTTLFSNTLGTTIPAPNPGSLDCSQAYNTHIISDSTIKCRVYQGDNTAIPSIPTTIAISITKAISANTPIKFNILGISNAAKSNYPIGVVLKLANTCSWSDQNNLCAYYKSVTYLNFNTAPGGVSTTTTGSLTFNPTIVSAINSQHTLSASYSINSGDWLKISYYSQVPIPAVCSISSSNGQCYSYPTTNTIMIKATSAQSGTYTFKLAGMTNPYQRFYGSNTFKTQIWSGGILTRSFYSNYAASTITTDPTTSNTLSITFTPTLTPDYQLKYGFNNIARIQITHLLQNQNIQMIYITTGGEITLDTQYCNATMATPVSQARPYPFRFVCASMSSQWVKINKQSDFPAWTSAHTALSVFVNLRYTISNSQYTYGQYWNAYTYTHLTSTSSDYLVSQANGRFAIVQYLLPYLYVINLYTKSFTQRTCAVEQQCMFYGFLLPSTLQSDIAVRYMTFLLPTQFAYTPTQILDKCTLQPTTTSLWTFNCGVSRNNSIVTINYTPNAGTYNQWYNLINLDHSVASSLFTVPKYPGNHYQMQVNLWASNQSLVESQYVNLTTVYGYYLSVPSISFLIPNDADTKGLFDLTFIVGSTDILPAYDNSASNSITSAIEISFANSFAADLGTGLPAGSQIACLNISGLTFNTMGRIKCQLYPSVSTITFPTIVVTGYDRILAGTAVRIQFADLKSLSVGVTDYCKLGVSLTYYNYGGVKGYIYEPVSFVVGPPTAKATPKAITFTVSQTGSNFVGQLTDYAFSGNIASGFSPITPSDYLVVQFPKHSFEGRFHLNAQSLCSLASASKCQVFGLASQIYIQPSSTISSLAFSFTITKLLNAAYTMTYVNTTVTIFTVVGRKINALGISTYLDFTQPSKNVSAVVTSIGSIYGGDSGISYFFQLQLNSYLPESGKIAIFFPTIFTSLFTTNSICFLREDSQAQAGNQAYCQIIDTHQLVIVPYGALLSKTLSYYLTVTNIANPNVDLSSYKFTIETYYTSSVYNPAVISRNTFACLQLSLITVKQCKLQVSLSIYNALLPAQYQLNLVCPSPIRSGSQLKVYLSWNPTPTNGTCSSDSSALLGTECDILNQYNGTKKLTYLSIWLRNIAAQKLVSVSGSITNGIQGTYSLGATISFNKFVYMKASSNSYYLTSSTSSTTSATSVTSSSAGTVITSTGQAISIRSSNYPLNRRYPSIYTFAITKPTFSVSTLQIDIPSILTESAQGITCAYQNYTSSDSYFNLMIQEGSNRLTCSTAGQKLTITGLTSVMSSLSSTGFLYLTVKGLLNPETSVSSVNFTFTFINTTSTYTEAVLLFTIQLSYSVSNPPNDMQIAAINLGNPKYFARSTYTFTVNTVNSAVLRIAQDSQLGLVVHFPTEYLEIWAFIATPAEVNMTVGGTLYTTTNITLSEFHMFVVFPASAFSSQVDFTSLVVSFSFRNPRKVIDCKATPIFTISLFDFKGKSIYAQTLSNNQVCPTLTTRLYEINVTGNTKIPAGSSSTLYINIEKPAQNLSITPLCQSSAISFSPATLTFQDYKQTSQSFLVNAANGLSGSFNVTFNKNQNGAYTFYNDIQFITLNVYTPSSKYYIKVVPFRAKSVGKAIKVEIQLELASPTSFVLTSTTNCSSSFVFAPSRITVPAQSNSTYFTVTYKGNTVPSACSQTFTISSVTSNNYYLATKTVYYSALLSIDKTWIQSPMVLQLTTTPQESANVGHAIISTTSQQTTKYTPTVYNLTKSTIGANAAHFIATTSYQGTVYFAVMPEGTPNTLVTVDAIYNGSLKGGVSYGNGQAVLQSAGVNTVAQLTAQGLSADQAYKIAVFLNSTIGNSALFFLSFKTAKISNPAAIKIAMSSLVDSTAYTTALSKVLRINPNRIYIKTKDQVLANQQQNYQVSVMNQRYYVYDTIITPDATDDSIRPVDMLNNYLTDSNAQAMLRQFVPEYITTYQSTVREILNTVPKVRLPVTVTAKTYESVTCSVAFWNKVLVHAVILPESNNMLLSSQVINGLDQNNQPVITQHHVNVTSDNSGLATFTFKLLSDDTKYRIYVSAQSSYPFKPRLQLPDSQVLTAFITTQINPNLQKNKDVVISAIDKLNPSMAEEAKKMNNFAKAQSNIHKVDKTTKPRNHN